MAKAPVTKGKTVVRKKETADDIKFVVLPVSNTSMKSVMPSIPATDERTWSYLSKQNYVRPPYDPEVIAEWLELNTTHQACINAKALLIAGNGYEITANESEWSSAFKRFIKAPNRIFNQTLQGIIRNLVYNGEIFNNAYLQVRKGLREVAIYNVNAKNIYIKPEFDNNDRPIAGTTKEFVHVSKSIMPIGDKSLYTYKPFTGKPKNGETLIYHLRGDSINSDFYGEPTYLSVDSAIEESGYVSEFNINFFSNNAQPNYVIGVTGVKMSRKAEEEMKQEMTESLKGLDNAHRGLVLFFANEKAKVNVEELSKGYDESFSKLKKDIAEVISTAHLMPMELLPQSGSSNFGGGTATIGALKVFLEMVIKPRQEFYESHLNNLMVSLFDFDPKIKLKTIKITTEKDDAIVHVMYKKEGILTADEIREDLKRKELGKVINGDAEPNRENNVTLEGEPRIEDINTDSNNRQTDAVMDL